MLFAQAHTTIYYKAQGLSNMICYCKQDMIKTIMLDSVDPVFVCKDEIILITVTLWQWKMLTHHSVVLECSINCLSRKGNCSTVHWYMALNLLYSTAVNVYDKGYGFKKIQTLEVILCWMTTPV